MKKLTKLILAMAAAAVMIIGAGTMVMAAEYPEIGTWAGNLRNGYTATDTEGDEIAGGWASDNGIWYYFSSGKMVTNTFITTNGVTYYVGDNGAMHTGWAEFKSDKQVTVNRIEYDNIFDAFASDVNIIDNEWVKNGAYETLWIYCDENGILQTDKWITAYGLWYYMDGAFSLTDEWSVTLPVNNNSDKTGVFGFGKNSNMLVGWVNANAQTTQVTNNPESPYDNVVTTTDTRKKWVYYGDDGKQAKAGWNRIGSKWTYFVSDAVTGVKLVTNSLINDGTYNFYMDENGYMVTGVKTFSKGAKYTVLDENGNFVETHEVTDTRERYAFNTSVGKMDTGLVNGYYYADENDTIYMVENITTGGAISFTTAAIVRTGLRVEGDFFVVTKDEGGNDKVCFYDSGRITTNTAVSMGEITFIVTKDSAVLDATGEVKVGSVTYKPASTTLTVGTLSFAGVTKK